MQDTTNNNEGATPTPEEMEELEAVDPADAPAIAEELADRLEAVLDHSEDDPSDGRSH
jgi:hypothetical protein